MRRWRRHKRAQSFVAWLARNIPGVRVLVLVAALFFVQGVVGPVVSELREVQIDRRVCAWLDGRDAGSANDGFVRIVDSLLLDVSFNFLDLGFEFF